MLLFLDSGEFAAHWFETGTPAFLVNLFEFKVAEMTPPGSALAQLQERDYAAKYRGRGEPIHLVGVEFSRATRDITAFATADA